MKSPERPPGTVMKERTPQGCQAYFHLATGEPVIGCLEDGLSRGTYEAALHVSFTQPPLAQVALWVFRTDSEF